jgi:tetratricopeptide (TPR) repeat protein
MLGLVRPKSQQSTSNTTVEPTADRPQPLSNTAIATETASDVTMALGDECASAATSAGGIMSRTLSGRVCLSLLDGMEVSGAIGRSSSTEETTKSTDAAASESKMAQNALRRHYQYHLFHSEEQTVSGNVFSLAYQQEGYQGFRSSSASSVFSSSLSGLRIDAGDGLTVASMLSIPVGVDDDSVQVETSDDVHRLALDLLDDGNINGCIAVYKAYLIRQKKPGGNREDDHVMDTLLKLSVLCVLAGRDTEAQKYGQESLKFRRRITRNTSAPTSAASSVASTSGTPGGNLSSAIGLMAMGIVCLATKRHRRAIQSWRESIQWTCTVVGHQHTTIGMVLNNIGVAHYLSGDARSSLQLFEQSIELQRKALRSRHNNVDAALRCLATTMSNIGVLYEESGKVDKAVAAMDEALTVFESLYDPVYDELTEKVNRYTLRLSQPTLWGESPASAVIPGKRFTNPSALRTEYVAGNRDKRQTDQAGDEFGPGAPSRNDFLILGSLVNEWTAEKRVHVAMAKTLEQHERAQPKETRGSNSKSPQAKDRLTISVRVDVDDDCVVDAEQVLSQINEQAMNHVNKSQFNEAIDLFRSALRDHETKYGIVHHLNGSALHNIGMIHLFAQQYNQAMLSFREALNIRQQALGPHHDDVRTTRMKLGLSYLAMGDFKRSQHEFTAVKQTLVQATGSGHVHLPMILNNIGVVLYQSGDLQGAILSIESAYEHLLLQKEKEEAADDAEIATAIVYSLSNLGFLRAKQSHVVEAIQVFEKSKTYSASNLDHNDKIAALVRENLDFLLTGSTSMLCGQRLGSAGSGPLSCLPAGLLKYFEG